MKSRLSFNYSNSIPLLKIEKKIKIKCQIINFHSSHSYVIVNTDSERQLTVQVILCKLNLVPPITLKRYILVFIAVEHVLNKQSFCKRRKQKYKYI